ncbi:hypothetical protein JCM19039_1933 [Geomicrobium sp. JCM 19039]|nr:hypothetical protein JCM19039_1933 [Geomicrobium sp. JCM 19039]
MKCGIDQVTYSLKTEKDPLKFWDFPIILVKSGIATAIIPSLIATADVLGVAITFGQIPQMITD